MNRCADPSRAQISRHARAPILWSIAGALVLALAFGAYRPPAAVADQVGGDTALVVAGQGDPEPGLELIAAVYNSLMDRFFRQLDSRDLLDAAWEGARRALAQARRLPDEVDRPVLTGDRAADLEAFSAQYRALVQAAGPSIDSTRLAMVTADIMTRSVGEQHTYFLDPDQFARYVSLLTTAEGRVGLGITIQGPSAPFRIGAVSPGAPGEQAGVQEGDLIEAIDGQVLSDRHLRDVTELLRGEEGEPVNLTLRRDAAEDGTGGSTVEVTVVRGRYKDAPLTMRVLPEGVCHFKLENFPVLYSIGPTGRNIGDELDFQLERCEEAGGTAWIMDLRGNSGGNSIMQVMGRFLDAGPIMVERDRLGGRYEQATDGHLFRVQRPLVVLIDGSSASASEIFASATQEHRRGVVMGQRTAGALNTALIVRLPLGAGMAVGIREVFTGLSEAVVDEVGVTPDVSLNLGRDPLAVPAEAVEAALNPPANVGPVAPGPSPFEGVLSAAELKDRASAILLQPADLERPEEQVVRGEFAYDTLHYYASDSPSLPAARERALRLGWQGLYLRTVGASFPSPFSAAVSYYRDADGAHKDLREIYEPGEPRNPPQWHDVPSPVSLGDETIAQVGTGLNDGRVWISWRRGAAVYSVAQQFLPGQPHPLDEVARLARIMDQRAATAGQ